MKIQQLSTPNLQVTQIIMGTWQAGKKMWMGIDDANSIQAIRAGFEAGITPIDTADVYGQEPSEQIVAQAGSLEITAADLAECDRADGDRSVGCQRFDVGLVNKP
jgi:diketogulonate reductase-like aldo/keto reductase